jgi:hypothetical protein
LKIHSKYIENTMKTTLKQLKNTLEQYIKTKNTFKKAIEKYI